MHKKSELKIITCKEQLNANATYYIEKYERIGRVHHEWTAFYDSNFNFIEDAKVKYSNILLSLKRIVSADEKNELHLIAYDLEKLNDNFYLVKQNKDTSSAVDSIAKSLKSPQV